MNNKNWLGALTGLGFVVLAIAGFMVSGEPPDPSEDPVQEVVDFYADNDSSIWIGVMLQGIAASLLVFFGGYVRKVLRAAEGEGHMLSAVALAGATIAAIAIAIDATINVALVETVEDIEPTAVQALSALWSNDFVPIAMGTQVFMLATGISVVRHGALPKWLGWVAIVLGVAAVSPAGFFAFIGTGLWIAVTSIMLTMRERSAPAPVQ